MTTLIPVPEPVALIAAAALQTRAERGGGTARSVVVATALTTRYVTEHEVSELRDWHARNPDAVQGDASTLLGGLYGGAAAREVWAPRLVESETVQLAQTAAARTPLAERLRKLSAAANETDRRLLLRLHTAATLAYEEAVRQATEKMTARQRSATSRSKAAAARVASALAESNGKASPALLAAIGLTEAELLDRRFDTFAAAAAAMIIAAERRKLNAAASALSLDRAELEDRYGDEIDRRAEAATGLLVVSLGLLARGALSGHAVVPAQGEFAGPVPFGVVRNAYTVATTGVSAPILDDTGVGPSTADDIAGRIGKGGQSILDELVAENVGPIRPSDTPGATVQVRSTWVTGDPERPFEPHQALDGLSWVDTQPEELNWDAGEFPYVTTLEPGDHEGCQCELLQEYEPFEGDGEPMLMDELSDSLA